MDSVTVANGDVVKRGDRVELHPAHDPWMRGARFGQVTNVSRRGAVTVRLDRAGSVRVPADLIARPVGGPGRSVLV